MKVKRFLIFVLCLILIGFWAVFFGCPIKKIFGFDCPGCGMTRAFLSALRFDFKTAFEYHPLFGVFMVETAYVIFRCFKPTTSKKVKKIELFVFSASIVLLLIVWLIRQF